MTSVPSNSATDAKADQVSANASASHERPVPRDNANLPWTHRLVSWLVALLPLAVAITWMALDGRGPGVWEYLRMYVSIWIAGKLGILGALHEGIDWSAWWLGLTVMHQDFMMSVLICYNIDLLYRVPWLGKRLLKNRETSRKLIAAQPWLRTYTFAGTGGIVLLPITGTGSIVGSILGQIMGQWRLTTVAAVTTGTVIGSGLIALGTDVIGDVFEGLLKHPGVQWGLPIVVIVAMVLFGWWFKRMIRQGGYDADEQGAEDHDHREPSEAKEPA